MRQLQLILINLICNLLCSVGIFLNAQTLLQHNRELCKPKDSSLESRADSSAESSPNFNIDSSLDSSSHSSLDSTAQKQPKDINFLYNLGFDFLLDNTESSLPYWNTRTLYALKLNGEIGLKIKQQHSINLFGTALQNMGERVATKAFLAPYYRYDGEHFKANLGIFPRKHWAITYPRSYFREDVLFFNPLTSGLLLQYVSSKESAVNGAVEFIFDWFGGNLKKRDDEFFLLFGGKINFLKNYGFFGGNALVYHFKNANFLSLDNARDSSGNLDKTRLLDVMYYNIFIGASLTPLLNGFNKADISFGALSSIERKRKDSGIEPFYYGGGWEVNARLEWRGLGISEHFYFGKEQMRYFSNRNTPNSLEIGYGEGFYNGLPLYQASHFHQINTYYEYKNNYLKANISLMFYILPNNQLALQQMLRFSIDTHNLFKRK